MTRTQQLEQQPEQQQAGGTATELNEETLGLPRPLYAQIMQLTPADAEALSSLLRTYPRFSDAILQVAAGRMGNAAVQRAIATNARPQTGPGERPAHGALSQAEMHEFLDDPPARAPGNKHPLSQAEMHEFLDDAPARAPGNKHPLSQAEMHEFLDDAPAKAQPTRPPAAKGPLTQAEMHAFLDDPSAKTPAADPTASPKADPTGPKQPVEADSPRMAAARAYNRQHSELAREFNELTSYKYLDQHGGGDDPEDGRKLDPKLVASWQEQHGLQADGMVGPLTVAKAREVRAKPSTVASAPRADARPPV